MDRFEISTLRAYYGALLTERQDSMLRMRYDEDLSLGEIAQECGVSRQAVLDGIVKGEKHLLQTEEALHIVARDEKLRQYALALRSHAEEVGDGATLAAVDQILKLLEE